MNENDNSKKEDRLKELLNLILLTISAACGLKILINLVEYKLYSGAIIPLIVGFVGSCIVSLLLDAVKSIKILEKLFSLLLFIFVFVLCATSVFILYKAVTYDIRITLAWLIVSMLYKLNNEMNNERN